MLAPKTPNEKVYIDFDFTALFDANVPLTDATVTVTTRPESATDGNPAAILSGGCIIAGMIVSQFVINGVDGAVYLLECVGTGSDLSKNVIQSELPVVSFRPDDAA